MHCANCSTELVGQYCHACGQQVPTNPELALAPFVRQFAHELLHLDFKTIHSVRALFRPGFLTREFLDGHRREYLSPLKLYFVAAAIFFFAAPLAGFTLEQIMEQDTSGWFRQLVTARIEQRALDMPLFAERFNLRVQTVYTFALSISIFVAAGVLRALFRQYALGAHLVFALHYVAFLYLIAIGVGAVARIANVQGGAGSLLLTYAVIGPYLYVALRRVYGEAPARTIMKLLVLAAVTFVVDTAVNIGALLLTLCLV
jgi:hypothetical protein